MPGARGQSLDRHTVITRQPGVRGIITLLGADTLILSSHKAQVPVKSEKVSQWLWLELIINLMLHISGFWYMFCKLPSLYNSMQQQIFRWNFSTFLKCLQAWLDQRPGQVWTQFEWYQGRPRPRLHHASNEPWPGSQPSCAELISCMFNVTMLHSPPINPWSALDGVKRMEGLSSSAARCHRDGLPSPLCLMPDAAWLHAKLQPSLPLSLWAAALGLRLEHYSVSLSNKNIGRK